MHIIIGLLYHFQEYWIDVSERCCTSCY